MIIAHPSRVLAAKFAFALAAMAPASFALWPASGGGPLNDSAFATVADQSGNIYVAGEFRGVASFGGTQYSAQGLSDLFVAKYSPDGALIFVRTAGGPSVDRATAIAVDAAQNVYLTGYFTTSASFDNLPGSGVGSVNLPDAGNGDTPDRHEWFIARLQANGDWAWARQIGGPGQDEGFGIAIAPGVEDPNNPIADGVIAVGRTSCPHLYEGDGDISPIGSSVTCGKPSGLAVRIDTAGNWLWALEAGQANASEWLTGVAVDTNGLVYVSGVYLESSSLATPSPTVLPFTGVAAGGTLDYWQKYSFDGDGTSTCWDGGVLEYTTDAVNWYDILSGAGDNDPTTSAGNPARFTANGYNGTITTSESNPLGNRSGFCFGSSGYQHVTADLEDFAGQSLRLRWRFGAGTGVAGTGWRVDDVTVRDGASNVLFTDDVESGAGKWGVSSQSGSTPWSISTGDPHAGASSWFLPDLAGISDHRLATLNPIALPEGKPSTFIAKIGGTEVNTPFWQWATPMGQGVSVGGLAVDNAGKLFVAGTSENAPSTFGGQTLTTNGAFLARLQDNGGSFAWNWVRGATGGQGKAVALAAGGDAFLFGQYASLTTTFDPVQSDPANDSSTTGPVTLPAFGGARDLFVARIAAAGSKWRWVQTATPAGGTETAGGVAAGVNSQLYVVGDYNDTTRFGTVDLPTQGGSDVFVANLECDDRRLVRSGLPALGRRHGGRAAPRRRLPHRSGRRRARHRHRGRRTRPAELLLLEPAGCQPPGRQPRPPLRGAAGRRRGQVESDLHAHRPEPGRADRTQRLASPPGHRRALLLRRSPASAAPRRAGIVHSAAHLGRPRRHRAGRQRHRFLDPGGVVDRGSQHRRRRQRRRRVPVALHRHGARLQRPAVHRLPAVARSPDPSTHHPDRPHAALRHRTLDRRPAGLHRRRNLQDRRGDPRADARGARREERFRDLRAFLLRRRRSGSSVRPRHPPRPDRAGQSSADRLGRPGPHGRRLVQERRPHGGLAGEVEALRLPVAGRAGQDHHRERAGFRGPRPDAARPAGLHRHADLQPAGSDEGGIQPERRARHFRAGQLLERLQRDLRAAQRLQRRRAQQDVETVHPAQVRPDRQPEVGLPRISGGGHRRRLQHVPVFRHGGKRGLRSLSRAAARQLPAERGEGQAGVQGLQEPGLGQVGRHTGRRVLVPAAADLLLRPRRQRGRRRLEPLLHRLARRHRRRSGGRHVQHHLADERAGPGGRRNASRREARPARDRRPGGGRDRLRREAAADGGQSRLRPDQVAGAADRPAGAAFRQSERHSGQHRDDSRPGHRQAHSLLRFDRHDPAAGFDRAADLVRPAEQEADLRRHPRRERGG